MGRNGIVEKMAAWILVLPRFGSVRFSDHFGRTENLTNSSVQAVSVNPEPDLRFGSEGGLVPVLLWLNSEPNRIYLKKINLFINIFIQKLVTTILIRGSIQRHE
jgi:hypothetical protein